MARIIYLSLFTLLLLAPALGQGRNRLVPQFEDGPPRDSSSSDEFTFVRTIYNSEYGYRRRGSWAVDFPEADYHFIMGVRDWSGTILGIADEPKQIEILDEKLFEYPLIYFVEPGYMELSEKEAEALREYVLRGGFLFLDDFWGDYEWENVREQMRRVFPEYEIKDIPLNHSIFHCYFDIDEVVQVPGIGSWLGRGVTHEKGGRVPHYMGVMDEKGNVMVFIARNCDNGDAWEWINDPRYPLKYGLAAYKIGINVVIYAMTH